MEMEVDLLRSRYIPDDFDEAEPLDYSGFADDPIHHDVAQTTLLGFWIYLMSDCLIFATLFAVFQVIGTNYNGGPGPKQLFDLPYVAVETACLLVSSVTYGMAMISMQERQRRQVLGWLAVTFVLGLSFVGMEINEFSGLVAAGHGPEQSGFLSSYFTLVCTHGLHVASGLIWMTVMMVQVARQGLTPTTTRRLQCLSLFWHFLDVVWIGVFSIVYLMGVMS